MVPFTESWEWVKFGSCGGEMVPLVTVRMSDLVLFRWHQAQPWSTRSGSGFSFLWCWGAVVNDWFSWQLLHFTSSWWGLW